MTGVEFRGSKSFLGGFAGGLSASQRVFILLGDESMSCPQFLQVM